MVEQKVCLVAAEPGVPAEEPEPPLRQEAGEVVLGEIHVVVRGDERGRRPGAGPPVIDALARMTARAGPSHHRRRQPDELPDDLGHPALLRSGAWPAWRSHSARSWRKAEAEFRFGNC